MNEFAQPDLKEIPFTGDLKCAANNGTCGRNAAWHIRWRVENHMNITSLACDRHMDEYRKYTVFLDRHRSGIDCDMPGSRWIVKYCTA